jgi:hypothetical protein
MYAATGINDLYQEEAIGYNKSVISAQPIYKTEGRVLLARALATGTKGFGATNVGVIYTSDDTGLGMVDGVRRQAQETTATVVYSETMPTPGTNHANAVAKVKDCDVVIVCAKESPFGEILNYMRDGNVNKPVITSYVSANTISLNALASSGAITDDRQVFTNSWLNFHSDSYVYVPDETNIIGNILWDNWNSYGGYDNGVYGYSNEYWDIAEDVAAHLLSLGWDETKMFLYTIDSYTLAGYVAGKMFVDGLARVEAADEELTWLNYINSVENSPLQISLGGEMDCSNGKRLGAPLGLNMFNPLTRSMECVASFDSLEDIWVAVPVALKNI